MYSNLNGAPEPLLSAADIRIKGVHNLENVMAASLMALLCGADPGHIKDAVSGFYGLAHRMEFVRELGGASYYNDSKGTNVPASARSIESFSAPIVLIAGGKDKHTGYDGLLAASKGRVRHFVLIGQAAGCISLALGGAFPFSMAQNMDDAVRKAKGLANKGDVVLLSPACSSYDMFRNFEERGEAFKRAVRSL